VENEVEVMMRAECFYGEIEASVFEQVRHHSPCSCFK